MSLIIKRATKGSALTSSEIDANVNNLNNDKVEINNPTFKAAPSLVNNLIPLTGTVLPAINPSLNLDFANGKQLDPRITFSRNTVATYYDGKTNAKAEENLLSYSQSLYNTKYFKTAILTVTENNLAPDGTNTAGLVIPDTTLNYHTSGRANIGDLTSNLSAGLIYTVSIYVKPLVYTKVYLGNYATGDYYAYFDLSSTGTFISAGGVNYIANSAVITPSSNGYFRCSISFTAASGNNFYGVNPYPSSGASLSQYGASFTGDGTSGAYIWGMQLEQRSSATAYTPTTTAPISNHIPVLKTAASNVPRIDYDLLTKKCLGLLIEELRTNSLLNSTIDGVNLATQSITTTAVARTLSFYGTGTIVLSGTNVATITGLGAYPTRTTYTYTPTAGTLTLTVSGTVQYANDEIGASATSYIPTAGTTLSRAADTASMTGVNFSSWYNQSEGSWYISVDRIALHNSTTIFIACGYLELYNNAYDDGVVRSYDGTSSAYAAGPSMLTNTVKLMLTYNSLGTKIAYSGNTGTGSHNGNFSKGTSFGFGNSLNGHIKKLTYYPKALTSQELIGLTS